MIWFTTACVMIEDGEVGVSKSFGAICDEPLPTRVAFVARLRIAGIDPGVGLDEPGQVERVVLDLAGVEQLVDPRAPARVDHALRQVFESPQVHRRCAGPQPSCSRTSRRVKCASLRSIPWARTLSLTISSISPRRRRVCGGTEARERPSTAWASRFAVATSLRVTSMDSLPTMARSKCSSAMPRRDWERCSGPRGDASMGEFRGGSGRLT